MVAPAVLGAVTAVMALPARAGAAERGPLSAGLSHVTAAFRDVWHYQVAVVDKQPLTVANIVLAIVLLSLGYTVSRRVSERLGRIIRRRFNVDEGAAAAVQSIGFYLLLLWFTLFALRLVSFPMTVFTVIGGALAIGIGFGSQNVMNNFISGLILLLERPIRSGDLIEVSGTFGHVERIGARSTRVRTSHNTHVIVPNSTFLEGNVLNWTLSDDLIRTEVSVGVAYGSPTREVAKRIRQALDEHPRVLQSPEPKILFAEFGNDALQFEAHFWIHTRRIFEKREIESEVRFRIDDLFREAGIVIAFPQRDVHLDAAAPLAVRLVDDTKPAKP